MSSDEQYAIPLPSQLKSVKGLSEIVNNADKHIDAALLAIQEELIGSRLGIEVEASERLDFAMRLTDDLTARQVIADWLMFGLDPQGHWGLIVHRQVITERFIDNKWDYDGTQTSDQMLLTAPRELKMAAIDQLPSLINAMLEAAHAAEAKGQAAEQLAQSLKGID